MKMKVALESNKSQLSLQQKNDADRAQRHTENTDIYCQIQR